MKALLTQGDFGTYEITAIDNNGNEGKSLLIQTDWDFPGLASSFGWNIRRVPPRKCDHVHTDGTIDCPDCKTPASVFIQAATDFLDRNLGKIVDDPGYFS